MKLAFAARILAAAVASSLVVAAQAATVWDESVSGDLSSNGLAPTPLSFSFGPNTILGTTGDSGQGTDRDYFTFSIGANQSLTAITVLGNTAVSGGFSFMGIQSGPQLTVPPSGAGGTNILIGYAHYADSDIGTSILPIITPGNLGSGTYSVWVQDTNGPASYGFDFVISAVPEPGAPTLLLVGALALAAARRRKRR